MSVSPSSRPSLQFKVEPEDFVVDEIAAFEPSGVGDHLYIHLRKTNRGTEEVLRAVADELAEVSFLVQQKAGIADADDLRMYLTTAQKALDDFLTLSGAK